MSVPRPWPRRRPIWQLVISGLALAVGVISLVDVATDTSASVSDWTKTFTDPRLCAAIIDRLTYNGHIIETGTSSYRLAHTRARKP